MSGFIADSAYHACFPVSYPAVAVGFFLCRIPTASSNLRLSTLTAAALTVDPVEVLYCACMGVYITGLQAFPFFFFSMERERINRCVFIIYVTLPGFPSLLHPIPRGWSHCFISLSPRFPISRTPYGAINKHSSVSRKKITHAATIKRTPCTVGRQHNPGSSPLPETSPKSPPCVPTLCVLQSESFLWRNESFPRLRPGNTAGTSESSGKRRGEGLLREEEELPP